MCSPICFHPYNPPICAHSSALTAFRQPVCARPLCAAWSARSCLREAVCGSCWVKPQRPSLYCPLLPCAAPRQASARRASLAMYYIKRHIPPPARFGIARLSRVAPHPVEARQAEAGRKLDYFILCRATQLDVKLVGANFTLGTRRSGPVRHRESTLQDRSCVQAGSARKRTLA